MDDSDRFFVDDRGNVAQFYDGDERMAELHREGGDTADQLEWACGSDEVEQWAKANGYADEIAQAKRL